MRQYTENTCGRRKNECPSPYVRAHGEYCEPRDSAPLLHLPPAKGETTILYPPPKKGEVW